MRSYLIIWLTIGLIACNNNDAANISDDTLVSAEDSSINNIETSNVSGCYLKAIERDTLAASLIQEGNIITGKLTFDNFQKDGSTGTVRGVMEKDILKLVYRFQSEGMNSISEIYFKVTSSGLIHGIGEVMVKGDSAFYATPDNIVYESRELLNSISCETLPEKYRHDSGL